MWKPRRTFRSVAKTLADGLEAGTIELDRDEGQASTAQTRVQKKEGASPIPAEWRSLIEDRLVQIEAILTEEREERRTLVETLSRLTKLLGDEGKLPKKNDLKP